MIRGSKFRLMFALLLCAGCLSRATRADVITDWNQTALTTAPAVSPQFPPQTRVMAMVHAAMFDAVNSIDHRFHSYAIRIDAPRGASAEAAAAAAAHRVLATLAPTQTVNLDAAFAASLAQIPDGVSKTDGVTVGEAVAGAILALRSGDGSAITLPYTQSPGPGVYEPTPPAFLPANFVAWANVLPFMLRSASQFRPGPPPELTSPKYTRDFNEVKRLGSINSTERTAEQTEIANFWVEASSITWNRIARLAAVAKGNCLTDNARLFALINIAAADATITAFDTKYAYNFWRPVTAIRAADTDGNPDTAPDPNWSPLVVTPRFPDYTSLHCLYSGTAAEVLASFFHDDDFNFSITTSTSPGLVHSYHSYSQAAAEVADARVWVGFHFRTACKRGLRQGRQVGRFAFKHYLQPIKRHDRNDEDDNDN